MRYLSTEWVEAAARALAADTALKEATADVALTLEQVVTGAPAGLPGGPDGSGEAGGDVRWHVAVDHGSVALAAGPAPQGFDVRFTTDYATAAASGNVVAARTPASASSTAANARWWRPSAVTSPPTRSRPAANACWAPRRPWAMAAAVA